MKFGSIPSVRANKKSKSFFSNDRVLTSVLAFPVHIEGGSTEKSCVSRLYDLYFLVENVFLLIFSGYYVLKNLSLLESVVQ